MSKSFRKLASDQEKTSRSNGANCLLCASEQTNSSVQMVSEAFCVSDRTKQWFSCLFVFLIPNKTIVQVFCFLGGLLILTSAFAHMISVRVCSA